MPHREGGVKFFFGYISAMISSYHFVRAVLKHLTKLLKLYYFCKVFYTFICVDFLGLQ